ncbi:PAS/PAC sensor signal transduction histidine kinase [Planktothrix sp. PCC 11201]|uniref:PAS domain-containing protein n=1 Tax=Planktothrix sp. PCC 11201 TaxID=1729650 RepID=UPI0009154BEF|nr:PAS domain-containing protein [Planktothrix sp. PCC 11201]SKB12736.1 PAS/PAC sensor signal transduction histidine kinase [Planktothrix sp. PCC 11201]
MTLLGLSPLCSPNPISNSPLEFLTFSSELLIILIHYALAFLLINHLFTPPRLKPSFLSKVVKSLNINWADSQPLIKILGFLGLALIANGTLHLIHLLMWKYPLNPALRGSQFIVALIFFLGMGGLIQIINSHRVKKPLIASLTPDQIEDKVSPSHSTLDKLRSNFNNLFKLDATFPFKLDSQQPIEEVLKLTKFSIDKAADAILWVGEDGEILYVNDAACRSLGYAPEELLSLTIHDINPDFPATSWSLHWKILRRCGSLNIEARHRTKHNRIFPVEIMINHLNFNGREYQCAFARDISDRKQIERTLRERQGEYRSLVANIPGAVYRGVLEEDRMMVFLSQGIEVITGYPAADFIQNRVRSFNSIIHPDDLAKVKRKIRVSFESRQPYILEYRLIKVDGKIRWVYEKGQVIFTEEDAICWLNGAIFDITEKRQASEALKASEERLKLALAGTDQGLWDWNLVTGEVYFSPQWSSMLGYETNKIQGKARSWLKLVHPEDREQVVEVLKQHLEGQTPFCQIEHRMLSRSGEWKWILNQGKVVVRDEQQQPLRMTGTVKDIGDRRKAEEALRQSEARERAKAQQLELTLRELGQAQAQLIQTEKLSSLGQLVAGIAHEINNPITFIYGNINYANQYIQDLLELIALYEQHYPQPHAEIKQHQETIELEFILDDLPKILSSMKVGANRIREIVLSLRNFSRLDEADMKPVNIHDGLENTLLILQHRLRPQANNPRDKRNPPIQIIKEYGNLPKTECYPGQLNQVFMNLLNNAIDAVLEEESKFLHPLPHPHSPTPGWQISATSPTIRIRTELNEANRVVIRITDNGNGMTERVKHRLFEPFFTTKPVGKGTGLGLAISYQIIAKHHGKLFCASEVGKGTEFVIELPLKQEFRRNSNRLLEVHSSTA